MEQLRLGGDFIKMAAEYDPITWATWGGFPVVTCWMIN
jgi:hypothetical protein